MARIPTNRNLQREPDRLQRYGASTSGDTEEVESEGAFELRGADVQLAAIALPQRCRIDL